MTVPTFAKTLEVVRAGIDGGLHTGAQIFVARDGEILFDDGVGQAHDGTAMTRDTINDWWSSVKPVMPVALAILRERKMLTWDDRIEKFIPEFGNNGKSPITIRHVLTHTGGFRAWPSVGLDAPWAQIIEKIAATRLEPSWEIGNKAGYHARTGWFILGEIVRRLDGRTYDQFAREEIFNPLGMDGSWLSIPPAVYRSYLEHDRIAPMLDTSKEPPAGGIPTETEAQQLHPGGSGRGPIRELAKFYEMMLGWTEFSPISSQSKAELISPQRVGLFDHTFKHVMDWGMGFILNTERDAAMPYTFGAHASARAFGHSGSQSSCAFADPEFGIIIAWVFNGMPGEEKHQLRQREMNDAIYEDLGFE